MNPATITGSGKKNTPISSAIFLALLLVVTASIALVVKAVHANSARAVVSVVIYTVCLSLTYLSSSLYHYAESGRLRHHLRKFDHISIYLTIAGTYTPFTLVTLQGPWGWTLFGISWGLALLGTIFKMFYTGRFQLLSTLIYIAMGWLVMIAIVPIMHALPLHALLWLLAGGMVYTFGAVFFLMETVPYVHTVWHFFVIAGSFCHYVVVYHYVLAS